MSENEIKKEIGVQWIKAKSGNTYLCPVAAPAGAGQRGHSGRGRKKATSSRWPSECERGESNSHSLAAAGT
jgi:hypothetical protein